MPDWNNVEELFSGLAGLSNSERTQLVSDVKLSEMDFVINNCPKMKSPGLDGLTYEFYLKVWSVIAEKFVEILQIQLDRRRLVNSNTLGATKLVPKVENIPRVDQLPFLR